MFSLWGCTPDYFAFLCGCVCKLLASTRDALPADSELELSYLKVIMVEPKMGDT